MSSLSARLLLFVSLLLVFFFGLTIAALDMVFRDMSERGMRELLDAQLIALIAASDADEAGNVQPSRALGEPRFSQPGSGLYAQIRSPQGEIMWRSASALGAEVEFKAPVVKRMGEGGLDKQNRLSYVKLKGSGKELLVLSSGIEWELHPGVERKLIFSVAMDLAPYEAQLHRFRVQLLGWFCSLMALLLIALAFLLRIVLAPLRRMGREIGEIETGARDQLSVALPRELVGLAENLNALLVSERKQVERYRNTLGNLAHSLKTPLAVIRAALGSRRAGVAMDGALQAQIDEQVDRMDTIVQHQLKRATASGAALLGRATVQVKPVLTELRAALVKVYAHKDLLVEVKAGDEVSFGGDRGDLFELAGNLMDNACKWCRSRVRVEATVTRNVPQRPRLLLVVEDDGAGIDPADRQRILERGARVDEHAPGQGIGLDMVREIVEQYAGRLEIGASEWGGARVAVSLPGR